jgi:hypothetical protein
MKNISRFAYWASGLGILGSVWLWIMAAISGFSSKHIVCFSTGDGCLNTNNPYWTSSTALWLAPLIIVLILFAWFISMTVLPKNAPELLSALFIILLLFLVAIVAMKFAVGNGF